MKQIWNEIKLMGMNPLLILSALSLVFVLLAAFGGELLNLGGIGFEVIFPFFAAVSVGEWGKTKADANYDVIAAQSRSLFGWVFYKFISVFVTVSLFALFCMSVVYLVRRDMPLLEMVLTYASPALFLSTLAAGLNLCFTQEHISALVCGAVCIVTILARSLLRFPGVEYIYFFIRYAGDANGIWLINKAVFLLFSGFIWAAIYFACRKHRRE